MTGVLFCDQEGVIPHIFSASFAQVARRRAARAPLPRRARSALVDKKTLLIYVGGGPLMRSRLTGDSAPIYAGDAFSYRHVIT